MPEISLKILSKDYRVMCRTGQEDRLLAMGKEVEKIASSLRASSMVLSEEKIFLLISLKLADHLHDLQQSIQEQHANSEETVSSEISEETLIQAHKDMNDVIEYITDLILNATDSIERITKQTNMIDIPDRSVTI